MTNAGSGIPELAQIDLFLAAMDRIAPTPDESQAALIDQARQWKRRLEGPVRLALVGKAGCGKSSLINLLVGETVLPVPGIPGQMPVTVIRHGPADKTIASWWDRPDKEIPGRNLQAALALGPDVISLEINSELLADISFVEAPWSDDDRTNKQCVFALTRLADLLFWCADARASAPWPDNRTAALFPSRLTRMASLLQTHKDLTAGQTQPEPRGVVSMATPAAMAALTEMPVDFDTIWSATGAEALVTQVADAGVRFRAAEVEKIRQGVAQHVTPLLDMLRQTHPAEVAEAMAENEYPVPTVAPSPAHQVNMTAPTAETPEGATLLGHQARQIQADVQSGMLKDNGSFIAAVLRAVEEAFDSMTDDNPPFATELLRNLERSRDLLTLMRFEADDQAALDAARILLQLAALPNDR